MENYKSNYTDLYTTDPGKGVEYEGKINRKYELFIFDIEKEILTRIVKEKFTNPENISYLDFACGTGRIISFLKDNLGIINATGLDTSEIMISEAKKIINAKFICGNIIENEELLNSQKFDLITIFRLFLNIEKNNREVILKKIRNYLKDDGRIILNNHINRYSLIGFQFWIRRLLGSKKIINTATQGEFEKMIRNSGLEVEKIYKFTFLPGRNNVILLPWSVLRKAELFISKIPIVRNFCLSQIYVCKKAAQK